MYFFKDTEHLKKYLPEISKNLKFDEISQYLRQSSQKFILPYLGNSLFMQLAEQQEEPTEPTEKLLYNAIRDAASNYFLFYTRLKKGFFYSSAGTGQHDSERVTKPSIVELKILMQNDIENADAHLDFALEIITTHTNKYITDPTSQTHLFKNSKDIEKFINIKGHRAFIMLLKYIREAEEKAKNILENMFFELDDKPTLKNNVMRFVAHTALFEALPFLLFVIESDGIKFVSRADGFDTREHIQNKRDELLKTLQANEQRQIADARKTLLDDLLKNRYEIWLNSTYYKNLILDDTSILGENGGILF